MKLVTVGFLNKFVDVDDKRLKPKKNGIDNLNLALQTKNNPFKKPIKLHAKSPFNDPELCLVTFQKVCPK